jgi:MSHA pilin protein MshA
MKQSTIGKQSGFTLIELIVVVIILSILAVTAIPRFINLQGDATKSTLQGVKGALESAASITYAKSALQGEQKIAGVLTSDTELTDPRANGVYTAFGYPEATSDALLNSAVLSVDDWTVTVNIPGTAIITPAKETTTKTLSADENGCNVTYVEAADKNSRPVITVYGDGC